MKFRRTRLPIYVTKKMKQKTTADSPQFNGVAERAIGRIEPAGLVARVVIRKVTK